MSQSESNKMFIIN